MRPTAGRRRRVVVAAGLCALGGGAMAVFAGACSDPFSSAGYAGGDATSGGGGGESSDAGARSDAPISTLPSDGINDSTCMPRSCNAMQVECGSASDGCGRQLDCGQCHLFGQTCDAGKCGCTAKSADAGDCKGQNGAKDSCGLVADGCGGLFACPGCNGNDTCQPDNTCSSAPCSDRPFPDNACGTISDGCGSQYTNAGTCPDSPPNTTCNGGQEAGVCGCTPSSCGQQGWACGTGTYPDLCGGTITCGGCIDPPGQCNPQQLCTTCTRVYHILGYDDQCMTGAHPYAWACDCVDGGACTVPDGLNAAVPHCKQLSNTDLHAIYCCDESQ
jgi:hypothetical protein